MRRDWHGGILLPTYSLSPKLQKIAPEFRNFPYVELGWGDRDYYMGEGGLSSGIKALFYSDASALHVIGFNEEPSLNEMSVRVILGNDGYQGLVTGIFDTFSLSAEGAAIPLGNSLYGEGHFYAAKGKFSLANTCNTWTAHLLREGGCRIGDPITVSKLFSEIYSLP